MFSFPLIHHMNTGMQFIITCSFNLFMTRRNWMSALHPSRRNTMSCNRPSCRETLWIACLLRVGARGVRRGLSCQGTQRWHHHRHPMPWPGKALKEMNSGNTLNTGVDICKLKFCLTLMSMQFAMLLAKNVPSVNWSNSCPSRTECESQFVATRNNRRQTALYVTVGCMAFIAVKA